MSLLDILPDYKWIKLSDFQKLVNVPEKTLRNWCTWKVLPSSKRGTRFWWVDVDELREFVAEKGVSEIRQAMDAEISRFKP